MGAMMERHLGADLAVVLTVRFEGSALTRLDGAMALAVPEGVAGSPAVLSEDARMGCYYYFRFS
jgi:hypothetical protein